MSQSRQDSSSQSAARSYPAVAVALGLGLILSALASWAIYRWEVARAEQVFVAATMTITDSIEHCFDHQTDSVRIVAGLYESFPEQIGHAEYLHVVEPLLARCDALVGMYLVPRVAAGDRRAFEARVSRESAGYSIFEYDDQGRITAAGNRNEYFPILYLDLESSTADWYPKGFDLGTVADERATIESVRRTGRTVLVPDQPYDDTHLEMVFHPIYRRSKDVSAASPPPDEFAGVVVGLSSLDRIAEEAFARAGNPPLRLEVREVLRDGSRRSLVSRAANPHSGSSGPNWLTAAIAPRETLLRADDYVLALEFTPAPGMYSQHPGWLPLGVMLAGLLFTAIMAVYLYREQRSREQIAALAGRLAGVDARKNEFLAVLGHELRNPLAPIANALQVLRAQRPPSPATLQWAEGIIERQLGHLVRIVDDLLDVARISRGAVAVRDEPLDLRDVVQQAVEMAQPLIDRKHHTLLEHIPDGPVPARGDRARLVQVVANLLDNAAKYTPDGGQIDIGLHRDGDQAVLSVRDNGNGISKQDLPGIFDLFNQAPAGDHHATGGGLGVGLALARQFVEMHGGYIEANSAGPGAGSEFRIRLPLALPAAQDPEAAPVGDESGRRVLVVEDNLDVAFSFEAALEVMGHQVRVAHDGPTGIVMARQFRPDIAFLDIGLPGMDGYELARRLRQEQLAPFLVALTGYGQATDREKAMAAGFDRHLVKPVKIEVLLEVFGDLSAHESDRAAANSGFAG